MFRILRSFRFQTVLIIVACSSSVSFAAPTEEKVLATMGKAADFMANTVSTRGGYVYRYSEDLTQQWGEIPARNTQIWTQPPGTPTVGMMYLDAYKTTNDSVYLTYAQKAANALIWGQHPAGGWHYLIDFDMTGIRKFYDEVATRCVGYEEYYHYYGNCTYDDEATSAPTSFLLELYMTTLDPKYRVPLIKALNFILESQYPNGAWPQRYPLMYDYPHSGHADYTAYYSFNDGIIYNNIVLLLEAYEKLGNEEYRKAAYRAMDFFIISQCPKPTAGWAQQYSMDLKPAAARHYEPAGVNVQRTIMNINNLMTFYSITGNSKFLRPIPDAIEWIENSSITSDPSKNYTHASYYEVGTNKPVFVHCEGTNVDNERYWVDNDVNNYWTGYRAPYEPNIARVKQNFERINNLTPDKARAEYDLDKKRARDRLAAQEVEKIISSLDKRGAWITDLRLRNHFDRVIKTSPESIRGIEIRVYLRNMNALINYLKTLQK